MTPLAPNHAVSSPGDPGDAELSSKLASKLASKQPSTLASDGGGVEAVVRIGAALGDPTRVRLLAACFGGERCVCQLVALVGLSNATVSKHLSLLRDAGLLESEKKGRWVYYRLPGWAAEEDGAAGDGAGGSASSAAREAIDWVGRHVGTAGGPIGADREQMARILSLDPAALCRVLRAGGDFTELLPGDAGCCGEECC